MEYFEQEKGYTCGCACVRMAMGKFENAPSESELEYILMTNGTQGTDPKEVQKFF
jgi:hypothetical protein